jgi:signal peptidase I
MGSGWHFRGHYAKPPKRIRTEREKRVEADHLFLLSDNRDIHDDSRDYGTVPLGSCKQRVVFRLWGKGGWADVEHRMTVIR